MRKNFIKSIILFLFLIINIANAYEFECEDFYYNTSNNKQFIIIKLKDYNVTTYLKTTDNGKNYEGSYLGILNQHLYINLDTEKRNLLILDYYKRDILKLVFFYNC